MKKIKTIFMGTPDIAVPCLNYLRSLPFIDIKYVITPPDRPKGRGLKLFSPEVAQRSKELSLPLFQTHNINKEESFYREHLADSKIDLIIVFAFSQFLSSKVISAPRLGTYNIHTSLLPEFRGASPIHYALLKNKKKTGVSIQKVVKKMDAGDVYTKKEIPIDLNENFPSLYFKLKDLASSALADFIRSLHKHLETEAGIDTFKGEQQDETLVSFAPVIKKSEGLLNFNKESAQEIISKTKAFNPFPGTYCIYGTKRLKILHAKISTEKVASNKMAYKEKSIYIGCREGAIEVLKLQLEGKKETNAHNFILGNKIIKNINELKKEE